MSDLGVVQKLIHRIVIDESCVFFVDNAVLIFVDIAVKFLSGKRIFSLCLSLKVALSVRFSSAVGKLVQCRLRSVFAGVHSFIHNFFVGRYSADGGGVFCTEGGRWRCCSIGLHFC